MHANESTQYYKKLELQIETNRDLLPLLSRDYIVVLEVVLRSLASPEPREVLYPKVTWHCLQCKTDLVS